MMETENGSDPMDVLERVETELKTIDSELSSLVRDDELLSGMETISREEVKDLVDVRFGRKIVLTLLKNDGSRSQVFVSPDATVRQLQQAVERSLNAKLRHEPSSANRGISWKSFWRAHWLSAHEIRLDELDCSIREYNITSRTVVEFVKKFRIPRTRGRREHRLP